MMQKYPKGLYLSMLDIWGGVQEDSTKKGLMQTVCIALRYHWEKFVL